MLQSILLEESTISAIAFGAAAGVLFLVLYREFERIMVKRKIDRMQVRQQKEFAAEAGDRARETCKPMSLVAGSFGKDAPGRVIDPPE